VAFGLGFRLSCTALFLYVGEDRAGDAFGARIRIPFASLGILE